MIYDMCFIQFYSSFFVDTAQLNDLWQGQKGQKVMKAGFGERSFVAPLMLIALVGQAYSKVLQPSSAMVEPKQPPSPKASLTVAGKLSFNVTKCAITIEKPSGNMFYPPISLEQK